jgi:hypothetical protein
MKIEISEGTWLTEGGYVVELSKDRRATQKTSPGTFHKRPCVKCNQHNKRGWFYSYDTPKSLDDDWSEKLRIIEKLPFTLPELPSGYQWAGGYPQFRKPLTGDQFLGLWGNGDFDGRIHSAGAVDSIFGGRRLIVEKIQLSGEKEMISHPKKIKRNQIPFTGPGKYELFNGQIVNLDKSRNCLTSDNIKTKSEEVSCWRWESDGRIIGMGFEDHSLLYLKKKLEDKTATPELLLPREQEMAECVTHVPFSGPARYELMNGQIVHLDANQACLTSDGVKDECGNSARWRWCRDGEIGGLGFDDHSHLYLKRKLDPNELVGVKTTEEMRQQVYDGKPSLTSRVANYFVVEPAKGIYRIAKESMGYIVFIGLLSVAGYSCYNPSGVANFIKSCVPHVSISFEKPEIMK